VREGSERRESEQKRERLWLECERMRLERSQIAKKTSFVCLLAVRKPVREAVREASDRCEIKTP
jgi:hypothetical protein